MFYRISQRISFRRNCNIKDHMGEKLRVIEEHEERSNTDQVPVFSEILECSQQYSIAHQLLAAVLINKGIITKKEFYLSFIRNIVTLDLKKHRKVVTKIECSKEDLDILASSLLNQLNSLLSELGFRLRLIIEEESQKEMVALVTDDVLPKELCPISGFSMDELTLVGRYVRKMVEDGGECEHSWALHEGTRFSNSMSLMKVQVFIDKLIHCGWILEKNDRICLSSRAIAELEPILTTKYGCPTCALCQKVVVRKVAVVICDICKVHIHQHCWIKLSDGCGADEVSCPGAASTGCNKMFSKTDVHLAIRNFDE
ncbi:hypothetical protein RB195_007027 [Necator americanus]|uniref:Phorbol-ester/DAG-type domain-containing protein n=1 Tax=Necator americanus TaxID=51031 RepID=A0ABR1BWM6_NECAM